MIMKIISRTKSAFKKLIEKKRNRTALQVYSFYSKMTKGERLLNSKIY
jgi:hypothetical protein